MEHAVTNDHFDDMMKNIDERDKERDKKMKTAENARAAAQRKFEQDLACRLENLGLARKAASSAATEAQETAGRAATAAAQAATTRTTTDAGGRKPHTCVLIAGFARDSSRDEIYNAANKFIEVSPYGRELLSDSSCLLEAPYVLGSVAHFEVATEYRARKLVGELRNLWLNKEMQLGGRRYVLRTSVMKTKAEHEHNQRLMGLARAAQELLADGHPGKQRQRYHIVCWMGAAVVVGTKRLATLHKGGVEDITLHDEWYDQATFKVGKQEAEEKLRSAVRL